MQHEKNMNTLNVPSPNSTKKNPRQIFILAAGIFLLTLIIPFALFLWPEYQSEKLLETGVSAEAKILSIEPTGTIVNSQYQYRIQLEVYPEGGESYQTETKNDHKCHIRTAISAWNVLSCEV